MDCVEIVGLHPRVTGRGELALETSLETQSPQSFLHTATQPG